MGTISYASMRSNSAQDNSDGPDCEAAVRSAIDGLAMPIEHQPCHAGAMSAMSAAKRERGKKGGEKGSEVSGWDNTF